MKVVVDSNVLISGIFFGGPPRAVLGAWIAGRYELVISPSIVDEYVQTCDRLGASHPSLEYQSILAAIIGHATLVPDTPGSEPITADTDDDKFMLCAEGSGATVVSGDQHLLDVGGWHGVPTSSRRIRLMRALGPRPNHRISAGFIVEDAPGSPTSLHILDRPFHINVQSFRRGGADRRSRARRSERSERSR